MKSLPYSLLLLPFAKVVFFVRQNMPDIAPLTVEMDNYDETIPELPGPIDYEKVYHVSLEQRRPGNSARESETFFLFGALWASGYC
jgi:hypothetical protein